MKIVFIAGRADRPGADDTIADPSYLTRVAGIGESVLRHGRRIEPTVLAALGIVVGAYLIGSVSFAVVVSRAFGLPDPHAYGSKNPGATNVLRTGNRKAALGTLLGDGLKGFVAVFAAQGLAPLLGAPQWSVAAAALAVFVGHLYPVFHRFAGGKGVATAAGIVFAVHWPLGLVLTLVWVTMAFGFHISSLAALTTALLLPLGMFYVTGFGAYAMVSIVIASLLFWRHRSNIRQLLSGRERSIGQ
jgi:acyl phosphate:glycerol-3-phosphate acyltransferase